MSAAEPAATRDWDRVVVASANLRDLGGVATANGSTVRRGRLYRSGYLSELTPGETATVTGLGLRTIVDLRRPIEVELRPTPVQLAVEHLHVSTSPDDNEFAVIAANIADPAMVERAAEMGSRYYRSIVTDLLERYRPVFSRLIDADTQPALFHCTAGKDRTGFVAAMLLGMLGVDHDEIVADYTFTNAVRREWIAPRLDDHRQQVAATQGLALHDVTETHLTASYAVLLAQPDYIRASLAAVTDRFGTWESFRRDGLGIDDHRFEQFRAAMLE